MQHPNEAIIRSVYEAFAHGDMRTVESYLDDAIIWRIGGRGPLAGDYRGKQEVLELFQRVSDLTEGTYRLQIHDVLANDEHAVALTVARGERNGRRLEDHGTNPYHMGVSVFHMKDGKAVECLTYPPDQYAVDEFWS